MSRITWVAALAFAVFASTATAADPPKRGAKDDGKVNPLIAAQMEATFKRFDTNKDAFLDKFELARMFRGPAAKPPPEPKKTEGEDKPVISPNVRPIGGGSEGDKAGPSFPDKDFLESYDKDGDGKISRDEFGDAYKMFEDQYKEMQELQEKLEKAQQEFQKRANEQAKRQLDQLRRQQYEQQRRFQDQLRRYNEQQRREQQRKREQRKR